MLEVVQCVWRPSVASETRFLTLLRTSLISIVSEGCETYSESASVNQLLRPSGLSAATWPGPVENAMKVSLPEFCGCTRPASREYFSATGLLRQASRMTMFFLARLLLSSSRIRATDMHLNLALAIEFPGTKSTGTRKFSLTISPPCPPHT